MTLRKTSQLSHDKVRLIKDFIDKQKPQRCLCSLGGNAYFIKRTNKEKLSLVKQIYEQPLNFNYVSELLDTIDHNDNFYLIFKGIEGISIADWNFQSPSYDWYFILNKTKAILQVIDHIHSLNIAHLDLHPLQWMESFDSQLILTDLDEALFFHKTPLIPYRYKKKHQLFYPPEIYDGVTPVDLKKIDVWQLGVLFFLFTQPTPSLFFNLYSSYADLVKQYRKFPLSFSEPLSQFASPKIITSFWQDFIHSIFNLKFEERPSIQELLSHPVFDLTALK